MLVNMKTLIRNFLSVLRRFKAATILNILGLSVAFAAFMIILMQVNYEQSFDRVHPNADRIYCVERVVGEDASKPGAIIQPRAFVDAIIASSPQIEASTLINPYIGEIYVTNGNDTNAKGFRETFVTCYPGITNVFGFVFTEGSGECLNDPEKVIIPESMARRFYGDIPAVGQPVCAKEIIWSKDGSNFTVGGVYKDFPGNTQLLNAIYSAINNDFKDAWDGSNFLCYILLGKDVSADQFTDGVNHTFDFSRLYNPNGEKISLKLTPLTDIYYQKANTSVLKSGNANTVRLMLIIALLVMTIAAINFTNFSIALVPMRIKSINTQKVLGSSTDSLRRTLLVEALSVTFISWIVALFIVWILGTKHSLPFIEANISLTSNISLIGLSGLIALGIGLVAGLYPAWYTTSFQPAVVLKGNFGVSAVGRILRTSLIGFQFVISIGLIVAAIFVQLQNNYMRTYNQGFDKDQVAVVELNNNMYRNNKDLYVSRLKTYPGIENIAFSKQKLGARDSYSGYSLEYNGNEFGTYLIEVSASFMDVMDIPVISGRRFREFDEQSNQVMYVFSQSIQKEIGMEPGSLINAPWPDVEAGPTVGIVGNIKFTSLRQGTDNISFMVNSPVTMALPVSYIRLKAGTNITEAVEHIKSVVADIDPTYPFDVEFYDTIFNQLYQKEVALNKTITWLSALAIIISIVGVFGLTLFETQYRRKEIGIRKVHGAKISQIINMFNKVYFRIICVCFIIAAPISWYGVNQWLQNFSYKTPVYWWAFAIAFLVIAGITLATITLQNWRAATINPVESIKTE